MIKITVDTKDYQVSFSLDTLSPKYGKVRDSKILVKTSCIIGPDLEKTHPLIQELHKGSATQRHDEVCNLIIGHKHAFARALTNGKFSKSDRASFWKKYKENYPIKD